MTWQDDSDQDDDLIAPEDVPDYLVWLLDELENHLSGYEPMMLHLLSSAQSYPLLSALLQAAKRYCLSASMEGPQPLPHHQQ